MTTEDRSKIEDAIQHHERYQNSYFWANNGNAQARRREEDRLNYTVEVQSGDDTYSSQSCVSISRQNFYYKGLFIKNGKRGDVRLFKKLIKED